MSVYCKLCGEEFSNLRDLVNNSCRNHPNGAWNGNHQIYEGSHTNPFCCKFCGEEFSSLHDLVNNTCRNHPNGGYNRKHEPL